MRALALLALACVAACKTPTPAEIADAATSPQASAMPAPLANAPATPASAKDDAVPLRGDVALENDGSSRDAVGYTLSAVFRQVDVIGPVRAPEVNNAGLDAARKKTELRLAIDMAGSRMRVALAGHGFVLPPDTELRSRMDRYGHVVVWPGGETYRTVPPGALRALLGERRFDVAPIAPAEIALKEDQGKRIGVKTRRADVATRAAKATFEIGRLPDLGDSGVLLCRLLLDLMNAPPQAPLCGDGELPMRADIHWTTKGGLTFELTGLLKKADPAVIAVPPASAAFTSAPFPVSGVQPLFAQTELLQFRNPDPTGAPPAPDGLAVVNASDELRMLFVDGVPVAWAAPNARDTLRGIPRGRYVTQWRTFLGDGVDLPLTQTVPMTTIPDAGVK